MTSAAKLMIGLSLIIVPTIIYGGLSVLGVITGGAMGAPAPRDLTAAQQAFYRAGHAHAGVLMILSLIVQLAADHARLGSLEWPVRIGAPLAAVLVSAGFFIVAHAPALRIVLYTGALVLATVTVTVGVALVRAR
jgi:hypothetical protein